MDFDDIKLHLDRLFAPRPGASARDQAAGLREALIEFKIGIGQLGEALARGETELAQARREAADYERRGRLAADIGDTETVALAEEFATKAAARVELLERKVLVQRDELRLAEQDYEQTKQRFSAASRGIPYTEASPATAQAEPGGMPDDSPFETYALEQRAREAAVEAQLAHLKKQLGERP
jgi:phage shock protein A